MLDIHRLVWDDWKIRHVARNDVQPEQVEEVCNGRPLASETYAGRIRAVGPTTAGLMLTVMLAPADEGGVYFVVTARSITRGEWRLYLAFAREEDGKPDEEAA